MLVNRIGEEREPAPVTLPKMVFHTCADDGNEIKEAAARFCEKRIIRAGIDAWRPSPTLHHSTAWKAIGAALSIGKAHALRVTGANQAWGRMIHVHLANG